jgi:hypothetical protein
MYSFNINYAITLFKIPWVKAFKTKADNKEHERTKYRRKKITSISYQSSSNSNTPGGKWRTKLDNTSAEENEMGWQLLGI